MQLTSLIGAHLKAAKEIAKAEYPSTELRDVDLSKIDSY
jgi:hypothetical protein